MSAARVLNPVALTEFCKMRASPSAVVNRNLPCGRQVNRIKRDLFGPANPVETNKIFTEEMEKYQEKAIKKWGFDFRSGSPLCTNSQYIWERVSFQESSYAPEMYTLTRAAHVRPSPATPTSYELLMDERAERENYVENTLLSTSTDTDSCDDSQDESLIVFKVPTAVVGRNSSGGNAGVAASCANNSTNETSGNSPLRRRQPKITEYMKERKRLAQTPKKISPAKRMRTNSGGGSSTSSSNSSSSTGILHYYSSTTQQQSVPSISSHFTVRSIQRKN